MQQDQLQSDNVLEDVACMLGCTRSSLHGADLNRRWPLLSPLALGADPRMSLLCSCSSSLQLAST